MSQPVSEPEAKTVHSSRLKIQSRRCPRFRRCTVQRHHPAPSLPSITTSDLGVKVKHWPGQGIVSKQSGENRNDQISGTMGGIMSP